MNRRLFLKLVTAAGIPLANGLSFAKVYPDPDSLDDSDDPFEIMTPGQIKAWLGPDRYVAKPVFRYYRGVVEGVLDGGTNYCVKTVRLQGVINREYLQPKSLWVAHAQAILKPQIMRLGLTHIHSVRLCESPHITPDWSYLYIPWVRGAKVNL